MSAQPSQPELYHHSNFPVFILQEESGESPGSQSAATSSSSGGGSSDRFVAAANGPRPSVETASSSSSSGSSDGTSPHDVRPLHGGAAFYGFPSFGSKPGEVGFLCMREPEVAKGSGAGCQHDSWFLQPRVLLLALTVMPTLVVCTECFLPVCVRALHMQA